MLLQMEKDGKINLGDYPPNSIFLEDYTTEFGGFVNGYYEDNKRAYRGGNYVEYGERLKDLWTNRVVPVRKHKNWNIGQVQQVNS